MEIQQQWGEQIAPPKDSGLTNQVWQVSFCKDSENLLCIVGDLILVFDIESGRMARQPLKGIHKSNIHCISHSENGLKFATASSDKNVVIWHNNFQPEFRYSHNDSVQCMVFNPATNQLFSAGVNDYVLYTPGTSQPERFKSSSKILCADYSPDGQILAIGSNDGKIILLNKIMTLIKEVTFGNTVFIWTLRWSPITPEYNQNLLVVGSWNKKVSFLNSQGKLLSEKKVDSDCLCIKFIQTAEFLLISQTDNCVHMYSREMHYIQKISENKEYIWDIQLRQTKTNSQNIYLAQGGNNGSITLMLLKNLVVNSFDQDKYVSRQDITDILIQQIDQDKHIRIKCKELVKNVSIYKQLIAVQLQQQLIIYQQSSLDQLKYKLLKKITKTMDCNQMILLSNAIVYSKFSKLVMINFSGVVEREWVFNSNISYIRNTGGAQKKENILIGLKNGQIHKVCIDNPFNILVIEQSNGIKQVEMNKNRDKIAVIDINNNLTVWELENKKQIHSEMNVNSVSWNSEFNDLLAYSGGGMVFVKCGEFSASFQKMNGEMIAFKANQLIMLDKNNSLQTIDVPQTHNLIKYIENKQYEMAYKLACLGITDSDFQLLGQESLSNGQFDIAKKCFLKIQDLNYLDLTNKYEQEHKQGQLQLVYLQAELQAYQKKFQKAAQILIDNNMSEKAIDLFTELKRWDEAKKFIQIAEQKNNNNNNNNKTSINNQLAKIGKGLNNSIQMMKLVKDQAEHLMQLGDWQKGCELLLQIKDYKKVVEIYGEKKAFDNLIEVTRQLDKSDNNELIRTCAVFFKKNQHHSYAKEAFLKLGDNKQLMELHILLEKWEEAFILGKQNESYMEMLRLPYAEYLCKIDRFEDALKVYKKMNRPDISHRILNQMVSNSVQECRFRQSSNYYWNMAIEYLVANELDQFHLCNMIADVFYAYYTIYQFNHAPFSLINANDQVNEVFNSARYLANMLNIKSVQDLQSLNQIHVFYSLAKVSAQLQAFKTSRLCYEKLQKLVIPSSMIEEIELNHMLIKSKPFSDSQTLFSVCNRCLNANQILQSQYTSPYQYSCLTCQHPFILSAVSFQALPLVEFQVEDSISFEQVQEIINNFDISNINQNVNVSKKQSDGWDQNNNNNNNNNNNDQIQQSMDEACNTVFFQKMNSTCEIQLGQKDYLPIILNENELKTLNPYELLWVDFSQYNPNIKVKYYKNMQPEILIDNCQECGRFFLLEEYELHFQINQKCPFCNYSEKKNLTSFEDNI